MNYCRYSDTLAILHQHAQWSSGFKTMDDSKPRFCSHCFSFGQQFIYTCIFEGDNKGKRMAATRELFYENIIKKGRSIHLKHIRRWVFLVRLSLHFHDKSDKAQKDGVSFNFGLGVSGGSVRCKNKFADWPVALKLMPVKVIIPVCVYACVWTVCRCLCLLFQRFGTRKFLSIARYCHWMWWIYQMTGWK